MSPPEFFSSPAIRTFSHKVCTRMWRIFCTWDAIASSVTFCSEGHDGCLDPQVCWFFDFCNKFVGNGCWWNETKSVCGENRLENLLFFLTKIILTWFWGALSSIFFGSNKLTREMLVQILVSPFAWCFKVSIPYALRFTLCLMFHLPGPLLHPPKKNLYIP